MEDALECCARIGYPIMLKASWGGGGKGIRKARPGAAPRCARAGVKRCWRCQAAAGGAPGAPCPFRAPGAAAPGRARPLPEPGGAAGAGRGGRAARVQPGAGRGARLARLRHEAGARQPAPGGAAAGGRVRRRRLGLLARLLRAAPAPEDRRGGPRHQGAAARAARAGARARAFRPHGPPFACLRALPGLRGRAAAAPDPRRGPP